MSQPVRQLSPADRHVSPAAAPKWEYGEEGYLIPSPGGVRQLQSVILSCVTSRCRDPSGTAVASRVHSLTRPNLVSVGTIVWLSSELMFFAGLFAMYFTVRRTWPAATGQPTPTELNLPCSARSPLILVASSVTCQLGVFAAERGDVFGLRSGTSSPS